MDQHYKSGSVYRTSIHQIYNDRSSLYWVSLFRIFRRYYKQ